MRLRVRPVLVSVQLGKLAPTRDMRVDHNDRSGFPEAELFSFCGAFEAC